MDYRFSFQRPMRRNSFCSMKGTIVDLVPAGQGGRRADGCLLFAAIEDTDGNTVTFYQPRYLCGGFYYVVSGNDGNLLVSQRCAHAPDLSASVYGSGSG